MAKVTEGQIVIDAPRMDLVQVRLVGTAPYVQNAFGGKALAQMRQTQSEGSKARTKNKREPKDFDACYEDAIHYSTDGWVGVPASCFRAAMISACRVAGVVMTQAKLCIFIEADGVDRRDGSPLVRIHGKREKVEHFVRNDTGVPDIRARPMWRQWYIDLRVRYDALKFDPTSVYNLLLRAGMQVGIGEGRPDSKKSVGMGWGTFTLTEAAQAEAAE